MAIQAPYAVTVDRREGPYGEVVLRERGAHFEIIANGCFLMDTSDGRSERLLVDAAHDALSAPQPPSPSDTPSAPYAPSLLIGGLGVGFSLARAAEQSRWGRIVVIERERAVIDWHREGPLSRISGAALADPRCEIIHTDLVDYVRENRIGSAGTYQDTYDALCLDIDNGPDWTVTDDNANLYSPQGLAGCMRRLRPGGILAVWSAQPSPAFEDALRNAGFNLVRTEEIQVARGVPDVVHLAVRPA
ncbi:spermidine synthase [Streptomyces agglomeratus]|uniref:Spermidine synthase n=1 Tax=Streptomyces agglomeratus TaxID=285458 RepID=A0A1E5P699_9ACTN|nr:spermidine synthase [Streptomyces agglomeratus]OEJ25049.1 spermidine synthase [Streptomyces agglomeratus]OEJ40926.1 spermidine synthase [Streptomyces agglomeratus]OEJ44696.1 spermidine synthase [Streptomyces agglomeratus]OEJ53462.1 spermidine synthase [Streptomyces agglomeratus]